MQMPPAILPNETELFIQMSKGNEAAFTEIFYHYTQRIYQFIFSITKSAAETEEIVQEVFLKLWKKRSQLSEVKNFESYLVTMAANKTYDFLRKMATEKEMKRAVWERMQTSSNITLETLDLRYSKELLNEAVDQLSPRQKEIFLLSREQGLDRFEIAKLLGLSPNTVNNHLTEALRQVRQFVQDTPGGSLALLLLLMNVHLN